MPLDSKYVITTSKLTAIGDAIRTKTGSAASMTLDEMVTAIGSISGGGSSMESGTVTGNNSKTITFPCQTQPSHVAIYSPAADFGTDSVWNTIALLWNSGEVIWDVSSYSTSNIAVNKVAESNVTYTNGTLTIANLKYPTRSGKTYYWYAW